MKVQTDLKSGFTVKTKDVPQAGIIGTDEEAAKKCKAACSALGMCPNGNWNNNWPDSSCGCTG
jgi:hypothetical protein